MYCYDEKSARSHSFIRPTIYHHLASSVSSVSTAGLQTAEREVAGSDSYGLGFPRVWIPVVRIPAGSDSRGCGFRLEING